MKRPGLRSIPCVLSLLVLAGAATALAAPSNQFTLGDPILKNNGSATIPTTFPGAGVALVEDGRAVAPVPCGPSPRIKRHTVQISGAGVVQLPVAPNRTSKRKLARHRAVNVNVYVAFTPTGGVESTQTKIVQLHKAIKVRSEPLAQAACSGPPH